MQRLRITHPAEILDKATQNRIRLDCILGDALRSTEAQLQWRQILRGHFADMSMASTGRHGTETSCSSASCNQTRLIFVDKILHESFECRERGIQFSTAAALKEGIQQEVKASAQRSHMEHAKDGMAVMQALLEAIQ